MELYEKYVGLVFDNRYRIERVIGIGGMAVVFKATDILMRRMVAVKILKDEISGDDQSVKRFINESKAVAMLSHQNIVNIYDVSVRENIKYIVMEYVEGITLKNYIQHREVLNLREIISYTSQILRALEHAHKKGIVHRDIKPQNIMLLKNGVIKVTDFGIAKLPNTETVTMTEKAIGTVYYISPEQASGKDIDAAVEQVRAGLARTITRRFCEDGQLRVITLDAEVERRIIASLTRNEQGTYLAMGAELMQQTVGQIGEHIRKFNDLSQTPIVLVSQVIRGYFSKMITQFYPNVYVLAFNEIAGNVQIQALGNVTVEGERRAVNT